MATTWKEEQSIARFEILHSAKAVMQNAEREGDAVTVCFASAVATYLQAELDCEAQERVRTLPPFDAELDHDGETQPAAVNPLTPSWQL